MSLIVVTYSWCFDKTLNLTSNVGEIDYSPDGTKVLFAQQTSLRVY